MIEYNHGPTIPLPDYNGKSLTACTKKELLSVIFKLNERVAALMKSPYGMEEMRRSGWNFVGADEDGNELELKFQRVAPTSYVKVVDPDQPQVS